MIKYKLTPENMPMQNINSCKKPSPIFNLSKITPVKNILAIVNIITLKEFICPLSIRVSLLFFNLLPFTIRVLFAIVNIISIKLIEKTIPLRRFKWKVDFKDQTKLIASQKTKFHFLFVVSQFLEAVFCVCNRVKSSIVNTCSYSIRICKSYISIIANLYNLSKSIIARCLLLSVIVSSNCALAEEMCQYTHNRIKTLINEAEEQHKIPSGLLSALVQVESNYIPCALNFAGKGHYPKNTDTAKELIDGNIAQGIRNIDIGLAQLNYHWHGSKFSTASEMLNPQKNIDYAAKLLVALYQKHGNWQGAVRSYHSSHAKHNRVYSRKVVMHWLRN